MAKANVYNMAGQQVGEIELSEAVFGIEPNQAVVHEAAAKSATAAEASESNAKVSGVILIVPI